MIKLLTLFVVVPLVIWGLVILIGAIFFVEREEVGLTVPRATPREGYEIIYPYVYSMGPDKGTFYYLSNKRQVIYRYDENRYLELQGENCEGLIWYHDDEKNIHTRIDSFFFTADKLPKFNYFNPGKRYIGIPAQDLSGVMFSLDEGRTFIKAEVTSYAAVPGTSVDRYMGVDDEPLTVTFRDIRPSDSTGFINQITISGDTGYFILKNNNVLFGTTVYYNMQGFSTEQNYYSFESITETKVDDVGVYRGFGKHWEIYYNPNYLSRIESSRNIQVRPYESWDKMRCEIGAEK
ncbi:hypothetical protein RCS94_07055 [Orbaceae bacterium ac157xtp]